MGALPKVHTIRRKIVGEANEMLVNSNMPLSWNHIRSTLHVTLSNRIQLNVQQVFTSCMTLPAIELNFLRPTMNMIETVEGKAWGFTWKLKKTLEDLDYADDICLLAHIQSDMQHKVDDLVTESTKVGLKIGLKSKRQRSSELTATAAQT